jgi:hypothetical protein
MSYDALDAQPLHITPHGISCPMMRGQCWCYPKQRPRSLKNGQPIKLTAFRQAAKLPAQLCRIHPIVSASAAVNRFCEGWNQINRRGADMNSRYKVVAALLTICLLWLSDPSRGNAQPKTAGGLLRNAYITLSYGNHDYHGHRYYAMREIEAAANMMKFDLRGDGPGVERQRVSDDQLRDARSMLEQARNELKGRPRKHVDKAIREINKALKTR